MLAADSSSLIPLAVDRPIWDRFFTVFPLVIVGGKESEGRNLAPGTWPCRSAGKAVIALSAAPSLIVLPTFPAREVDGVLVKGSYLFLECKLDTVFDGFETVCSPGNIVAAAAEEGALRSEDLDDGDQIFNAPLLACLNPGRFAETKPVSKRVLPSGAVRHDINMTNVSRRGRRRAQELSVGGCRPK